MLAFRRTQEVKNKDVCSKRGEKTLSAAFLTAGQYFGVFTKPAAHLKFKRKTTDTTPVSVCGESVKSRLSTLCSSKYKIEIKRHKLSS